jgi:hypothetical protein
MKKNLLKLGSFVFLMVFFPFLVFADCATNPTTGLCGIVSTIGSIFSAIIPVLVALGVVYFIWGVVMYVIADGEEAKKKGRDSMIFGIIGLTIIVGLWGVVNILLTTFNLQSGGSNAGVAPTPTELQNLLPK